MTHAHEFSFSADVVVADRVVRYKMLRDKDILSFDEVIALLEEDHAFRTLFIEVLASSSFQTYRWETPAVSVSSINQDFEFVLINSPGLAASPDRHAFRDHFIASEENAGIVVFDNLGRDAILVAPSPLVPTDTFNHLARFTRTATEAQNHALWKTVAQTMSHRLSSRPVWLNTAGGGISWLHVRLDNRPKYYHYAAYRELR